MWELDCEERWALKNWCFWTVVLEKTLESPLDCKEIQPVHPKGDQFWVFVGRTDAEAETPILWPPHVKSWLIGKDPDAGRDWGQEEKRMTEDEMAGWHHRLDGRESEWTLGVVDGQGGLVSWDSWGLKELDTTERLNWTMNLLFSLLFRLNLCSLWEALQCGPWDLLKVLWCLDRSMAILCHGRFRASVDFLPGLDSLSAEDAGVLPHRKWLRTQLGYGSCLHLPHLGWSLFSFSVDRSR